MGIVQGDGQGSISEASAVDGKFKAFAFVTGVSGGPLWVCTLPGAGRQEARAGAATPKADIDLIRERLKVAE